MGAGALVIDRARLIFNTADVAVVTKMDLAAAVEFDQRLVEKNIRAVAPAMGILNFSSKSGEGFDAWLRLLYEARR